MRIGFEPQGWDLGLETGIGPGEWDLRGDVEGREDRLPKGNMWSAIPIALLCMVVNQNGEEVL